MERRIKASRRMPRHHSTPALVCSFPPIAAADARVLILGSVPSIASLAKQQYYGHPQNSFWPIMGRLFGAGRELPYDERKRILHEHGVAVWDVLRECHREGSMDADIRVDSETPNDFATFFRKHQRITTIFFNGQRSESMFRRHVLPIMAALDRGFRYMRLPSTSPAHAGRNFAQKLSAWRAVARALQDKKFTTETQRTLRSQKQEKRRKPNE
jgi:hypoxanthine-DNA glycosylase